MAVGMGVPLRTHQAKSRAAGGKGTSGGHLVHSLLRPARTGCSRTVSRSGPPFSFQSWLTLEELHQLSSFLSPSLKSSLVAHPPTLVTKCAASGKEQLSQAVHALGQLQHSCCPSLSPKAQPSFGILIVSQFFKRMNLKGNNTLAQALSPQEGRELGGSTGDGRSCGSSWLCSPVWVWMSG